MTPITILGILAAVLTTGSYLPQVIKSWKLKKTDEISLGMYVALVSGQLLWIVYGVAIRDLPIIVANGASCVLASSVLVLKIREG